MTASRPDNEAIFHTARCISDPDRRREYVREACDGDEARITHVEALLAAADVPDSLLDLPAAGSDGPVATINQPTAESPGTLIGPYKLIEPIGEGGMGTVWMAQQTEPVRRLVALKLIKAGMDSKQVIARFEAERQALALMDHPNIAKVLDGGTTSAGRLYFVMDLVKGVPITRYCDEHHLTPRQRLELFIPVCQAVQHAHQKGIIHRDLKPSNVLVASYDGKPVPKVIDFGVAKAAGQALTDKTLVTGFGNIVGTLEYMSPEQAEINQLDVDTRSDVYSLGVLLYELLTGSTPFSRKDLEKAGMLEMLRLIREQEPSKPSTKLSTADGLPTLAANRGTEPGKLTRLVRGELDWIVMKALEKDRNRRYDTANGFVLDVQRYLSGDLVQACPPSAGYRLRKFVSRRRGPVLAAGSVFVMLLALLAIAWVSNWQVRQALGDRNHALGRLEDEQETTAEALVRETGLKNQATEALEEAKLALYSYRVSLAHREWYANHVGRAEFLLDECPATLRGWEWHYLKRLCHADLVTIRTKNWAYRATFSPDGKRIASCSADGFVRIWDAATGREVRSLRSSANLSYCPIFSPDGRLLAVGCDRTIRLWDAATGQALRTFDGHDGDVFWLSFSPDGQQLAAISNQSGLTIWDVARGQVAHTIQPRARNASIRRMAFSHDGAQLVWVESNDVVVAEAATGKELHRWSLGSRGMVQGLTLSSNGRHLAIGGGPETPFVVWDVASGKEVLTLGRGIQVRDVVFSPDGRRLATAHADQTVRVWDAVTGAEVLVLRGHTAAVHSVAFDPDGGRIVSASADRSVKVWNATAHQDVYLGSQRPATPKVAAPIPAPTCMAVSPDGRRLALGGGSVVLLCETTRGAELGRLKTGRRITKGVAFSPDGSRLATAHGDGMVRVWDVENKRQVVAWPAHESVIAVAFSKGGLLASAGTEGKVILRDAAGAEVRTLTHASHVVFAFSPDGQRLATGETRTTGNEFAVRIWEVATGRELHRLPGHMDSVTSTVFSPDGKLLATASLDRQVKLWDAGSGKELRTLGGHASTVTTVAFHPTGKRLAAGTIDGTIVTWDLTTGRETLTLRGGEKRIDSLAFVRDGTTLVAASADGYVRFWDGTPLEEPPREGRE